MRVDHSDLDQSVSRVLPGSGEARSDLDRTLVTGMLRHSDKFADFMLLGKIHQLEKDSLTRHWTHGHQVIIDTSLTNFDLQRRGFLWQKLLNRLLSRLNRRHRGFEESIQLSLSCIVSIYWDLFNKLFQLGFACHNAGLLSGVNLVDFIDNQVQAVKVAPEPGVEVQDGGEPCPGGGEELLDEGEEMVEGREMRDDVLETGVEGAEGTMVLRLLGVSL